MDTVSRESFEYAMDRKQHWKQRAEAAESRLRERERELEEAKHWLHRICSMAVFDGGIGGSPSPLGEGHDTFERVERLIAALAAEKAARGEDTARLDWLSKGDPQHYRSHIDAARSSSGGEKEPEGRNLEEKWKSGDIEITMRNYTLAKIAYDAYCRQTGGKSLVTGDTLPEFLGLNDAIQDAWYEAAEAVRTACGHGQRGEDSSDAS